MFIFKILCVGTNWMEENGLFPLAIGYAYTYNTAVKAQVTKEFATATFCYRHSLIFNHYE
jgi:hypothetical protein